MIVVSARTRGVESPVEPSAAVVDTSQASTPTVASTPIAVNTLSRMNSPASTVSGNEFTYPSIRGPNGAAGAEGSPKVRSGSDSGAAGDNPNTRVRNSRHGSANRHATPTSDSSTS